MEDGGTGYGGGGEGGSKREGEKGARHEGPIASHAPTFLEYALWNLVQSGSVPCGAHVIEVVQLQAAELQH